MASTGRMRSLPHRNVACVAPLRTTTRARYDSPAVTASDGVMQSVGELVGVNDADIRTEEPTASRIWSWNAPELPTPDGSDTLSSSRRTAGTSDGTANQRSFIAPSGAAWS
ncbi:hypothetical protein WME97_12240 [Sorangium sp. So ce367]|uniref:hypothetical protein n=1 Tax=Sorangium sp. So ce367 TaxID=3133305 RepID=UPI003F63623F